MKVLLILSVIVATTWAQEEVPKLYCRNDEGKAVEWFIVYKVPRSNNKGFLNSGFNYTYITGSEIETSSSSDSGSEASKPDASKPDASKPDASKPDASKPDASKPDASKPDASKPDVSKPDASGAKDPSKGDEKAPAERRKRSMDFEDWMDIPQIRRRAIDVETWHSSLWRIDSKRSIVGRTLAPLYAFPGDYAVAMYNDASPTGKNDNKKGYSKGVIAMTEDTGIFMTHSVPMFPNQLDKCYEYQPVNDGDMFFCVSFKPEESAKTLIKQVSLLRPNVYEFTNTKKVQEKVPDFQYLGTGQVPPGTQVTYDSVKDVFKGSKGLEVTSYVRPTSEFTSGDFFSGYLDRLMQQPLLVKSYRPGLKSECSGFGSVLNAKQVSMELSPKTTGGPSNAEPSPFAFQPMAISSGPWPDVSDRSRFVVTATQSEGSVCITDVDRNAAFSKRGGSAFCIKDDKAWQLFKSSVAQVENCAMG